MKELGYCFQFNRDECVTAYLPVQYLQNLHDLLFREWTVLSLSISLTYNTGQTTLFNTSFLPSPQQVMSYPVWTTSLDPYQAACSFCYSSKILQPLITVRTEAFKKGIQIWT